MHSKVFSDWMESYITARRPVLEIFKMAGYFLDIPRRGSTIFTAGCPDVSRTVLNHLAAL
jgi:hypothetical protein